MTTTANIHTQISKLEANGFALYTQATALLTAGNKKAALPILHELKTLRGRILKLEASL